MIYAKNFGVNFDQEGNLGLRYLTKVGDGRANQFYFQNF